MNPDTQIVNCYETFDHSKMCFSDPVIKKISDSLSYRQIQINLKNQDGSMGDFVIQSPKGMFSWGVQEDNDFTTKQPNGKFKMGIVMWEITKREEQYPFYKFLLETIEYIKSYLCKNGNKIGRPDLEKAELKKAFPALFYKKDKSTGLPIPDSIPTLYIKLFQTKRHGVLTQFYDERKRRQIPYSDVVGKTCFVRFGLQIESVYIDGSRIIIQPKLTQVFVTFQKNQMQMLMDFDSSIPEEEYEEENGEGGSGSDSTKQVDTISSTPADIIRSDSPPASPIDGDYSKSGMQF
jgi:hypothetical protein